MDKKNKKNKKNKSRNIKGRINKSLKKKTTKIKKRIKRSLKKTLQKIKKRVLIDERIKNKYNIIDVPLDKEYNKGTKASSGFIDYDYQTLNNIIDFLNIEMKTKKNIYFFKPIDKSIIEINLQKKSVKPIFTDLNNFIENIKKSYNKRYVPITINIDLPELGHANTVLIDHGLKHIEYFEPMGYKKEESTLGGMENGIRIKLNLLKAFFMQLFPEYKFIIVGDYFKREGFQMKYDSRNGYCVTWCILYLHYRLLNNNTPLESLIRYLYYHINLNKLLRYARYIEKKLKL